MSEQMMAFANKIESKVDFDRLLQKTAEFLQEEGFGILTEIDVRATLKKKLGVDRLPYRILGACNPALAHQVLEAEPLIGTLLPCNVVIWDAGDHRVVAAMEARLMSQMMDLPALNDAAEKVSAAMGRILNKLSELE